MGTAVPEGGRSPVPVREPRPCLGWGLGAGCPALRSCVCRAQGRDTAALGTDPAPPRACASRLSRGPATCHLCSPAGATGALVHGPRALSSSSADSTGSKDWSGQTAKGKHCGVCRQASSPGSAGPSNPLMLGALLATSSTTWGLSFSVVTPYHAVSVNCIVMWWNEYAQALARVCWRRREGPGRARQKERARTPQSAGHPRPLPCCDLDSEAKGEPEVSW